jgi:hypothetical protein
MAPVKRGRGNRYAHVDHVHDREEPVREKPPEPIKHIRRHNLQA